MQGSSEAITLYGFPTSPYVVKVAAYLSYKKLDYKFVGVNPVNFEQVAFTNRRQVPVLTIGEDWKQDSDEIAIWLEEMFPQHPLVPTDEHDAANVHQLNGWVNDTVIRSIFRLTVDWPSLRIGFTNGWKLSKAVNRSVGIPKWVQFLWPVFVRKAGFIQRIIEPLDRTESLESFQERVLDQFAECCDDGPFLGGRAEPSLADVSLYPLVLLGDVLEIKGDIPWHERAEAQAWIQRMSEYFEEPPLPSVIKA